MALDTEHFTGACFFFKKTLPVTASQGSWRGDFQIRCEQDDLRVPPGSLHCGESVTFKAPGVKRCRPSPVSLSPGAQAGWGN